jgi:hypothetical protein
MPDGFALIACLCEGHRIGAIEGGDESMGFVSAKRQVLRSFATPTVHPYAMHHVSM